MRETQLREILGVMNIAQVARHTGIHEQTLYRFTSGKSLGRKNFDKLEAFVEGLASNKTLAKQD